MIEKIVKEMTLKEKVGQLNQHLDGWQCYQKVTSKIRNSENPLVKYRE